MEGQYILELKGISKQFPGVRALSDVSVQIRQGTVHAFVGENGAGKSTLMNILCGQVTPDCGEILVEGKPVEIRSPDDAAGLGISMLHQELNVVPEMTVADNIFLGREIRGPLGMLRKRGMYQKAAELLQGAGLDVEPSRKMGQMPISQQQMVEIAKVLAFKAKIIIMDEPTSSISERESEELLERINGLKRDGITVIYISHRLEELPVIADDITVLRDGQKIITCPADSLSRDKMIELMVGRKLENIYPEFQRNPGSVIFEARGLAGEKFQDVSFQVRQGEILGIAGLVGAGRTEVAESIFGLSPLLAGEMTLNGKPIAPKDPRRAIDQGIALLSEDRRTSGLVGLRSIRENISLPNLKQFAPRILLHMRKEAEAVSGLFQRLRIKAKGLQTEVSSLSGGNQQKVAFAKWLQAGPSLFIADEPTRGVDVGAKFEIYSLLCELAEEKKAVIMISSDLPELLGICDRIMVMSDGRVTGELDRSEATQERIMALATKLVQ